MRRILVVEDEAVLRDVYATILMNGIYEVDVAENGKEALKLCKKHKYSLVLLDLMMPVINGVEFLKRAQLADTSPDTKVILFSNLSMGDGLEQALRLGAHRHILKSDLSPRQLLSVVRYELTTQ